MTAIRRVTPAEAGAITDLGFRSKAYWGYSPEETPSTAIPGRMLPLMGVDL